MHSEIDEQMEPGLLCPLAPWTTTDTPAMGSPLSCRGEGQPGRILS